MVDMDPRTAKLTRLNIWCACGYHVIWPRSLILARTGGDLRPRKLLASLRCSACGAKGPPKVRVHGDR